MFNFLWGKKIETLFENTIQNNMGQYKEYVKEAMTNNPDGNITEDEYMNIHEKLIQNVVVDVNNFMKGNPASIYMKFQMAMMNPAIVEPFFRNEPMSMAILYCVTYYAYTGKKANSIKATKQNHVLHAYTNKALHEIDEEL